MKMKIISLTPKQVEAVLRYLNTLGEKKQQKTPYKGSRKAHLAAKKAWRTIKAKKNVRK